ncbi:MAG: sulfatase-like hydrolase/transferase [Acidobacteriota bacterium]
MFRWISTACVFLAQAVFVLAEAPPAPPRPNVLLITVDTLRPDALGWIGGGDHTPALDRLAASGVRFPRALSPAPLTLPSHTSILTGLLPRRHGVRDNGQTVAPDLVTLGQSLKAVGYRSAAFVSGFPLVADFGLDGGFDHYDDDLGESGLERPAAATVDAALEWLRSEDTGPWFLWLHLYDPHDPYEPPAELRRPGPRGAYLGEVAAVDRALGRLLAATAGKSTLTVFTSDHGESLGEHGEQTHGFFAYQATLEVPLVISWPGRLAPAERSHRIQLVDLFPTLAGLLSLETPQDLDGVDLTPTLEGREQPVAAAYLESLRPWISYGWAPLRAVIAEGWKLIAAPRAELYDLDADPQEKNNLVDQERRRARALQQRLREIEALPARQSDQRLDRETRGKLRALGYLGGSSRRGEAPADAPDPKDRLDVWNLLGSAEAEIDAGRPREALALFDRALGRDPDNRFALARSADTLLGLGRPREAAQRARRATDLDPDQPEAHRTLALALGRLGDGKAAAKAWMEVVRLQPRRADGWMALGSSLGLAGEGARATAAFERAVELAPDDPQTHLRLGFARHGQGDRSGAIRALEEAARRSGASFAHNSSLGLLLVAAGSPDEARPWLTRATPREPDFVPARLALARLELAAERRPQARRALSDALAQAPALRDQLADDPALGPLLAEADP